MILGSSLTSAQQLFLLGGLAIAAGIITYSKRVMDTVGSNIIELSAEAAMVVVLAHSLVLFIFSSTTQSDLHARAGLPRIPMVPVSSTQVIVGCISGIVEYKGVRNINFKLLGQIALGWVTTPVISGLISFFSLFLVKNIFNIDTGSKITEDNMDYYSSVVADENISLIFRYVLIGIIIAGSLALIYYILLERKE